MKRTGAPTLEDVSRLARVSTATISRALNDPDKVAKKTRTRIQAAINSLGYTPNFGGRALASNRINTVGAIIPTMANAMFASGVQAFEEVLSEAGVTLLVASTGYDPEHELRQIWSLLANGAGGLLLIGNERPAETREFLAKRSVPYVVSWCFDDDPDQLFVGFDNQKAAFQATRHVLAYGHRNIAMIAGFTHNNDRARDRLAGVRSAIAAFGQGARLSQVVEVGFRLEYGAEAFARIMAQPNPPTAVICGNDVLAAGAMMQARDAGIRIPHDVSVTGFDDIGLAAVVSPPLATVRVPQIEMGRCAAELLLARISGAQGAESIELKTEFIKRASLGPANAEGDTLT